MKKKLICLVLAITMTLGLLPAGAVSADPALPTAAPLTIGSVEALEALAQRINNGAECEGLQILLSANLNLAGSAANPWTPIGTKTHPFKGTFDGQNHIIQGLYIDAATDNQGLFGYIDKAGTVQNLTVDGAVTTTAGSAAGLVGYNAGTLLRCANRASVTCTGSAVYYHGGIAGWNYGGTITGCVNTGAVSGYQTVGGIAGGNMGSAAITESYNSGTVSAAGAQAGGIVGQSRAAVQLCYNSGTVSAPADCGAAIGKRNGGGYDQNYYLQGTADKGIGNKTDNDNPKTATELEALAPTLGAAFEAVSGGYPALLWEKSVSTAAPLGPVFSEATALSKKLAIAARNAIESKKTAATPPITGSLLAQYTQSSTDTDWIALTMGRFNTFAPDGSLQFLYDDATGYSDYLSVLPAYVSQAYTANGGLLHPKKATEWQRLILTVNALGGDPTAFGTYQGSPVDLVRDGTYGHKDPGWQGINGLLFGLLALDSQGYAVPQDAVTHRADFIRGILALQLADGAAGNPLGGWALSGAASDPDITAMAIQALAPYYTDSTPYTYTNKATGKQMTLTPREAVEMALERLSSLQRPEGDFASWGTVNCESTAQVLTALCALGLDPAQDTRFIQNGNTLLDGLLRYLLPNGGFTHSFVYDPHNPTASAGAWNSMATDQAAYSLVAYWRLENGLRRLYDMRKEPDQAVKAAVSAAQGAISALPAPGDAAYKQALKSALALATAVPAEERSYIGNYAKLAAAIDRVGGEGALDSAAAYVVSMSVQTPPKKNVYWERECFDKTDMAVILTLSDGTVQTVTDYDIIPGGELSLSDTQVILRHGFHQTVQPITVNEKPYWSGKGTQTEPYLIADLTQLQSLATFVNTKGKPTAGLFFQMTADIDLASVASWPSIGTDSRPFQGTFDGANHVVLHLNGTNGLFGTAGDSAVIQNVGVASGKISGGNAGDRGGVVGACNGADLLNCWNGAELDLQNGGYSGGVAGAVRSGNGTISACFNQGSIRGDGQLGGVIGYLSSAGSITYTISDCYNTGAVSGTDGIGGIIGKNQATLTLSNCYNAGPLTASAPSFTGIGGIVGGNHGTPTVQNCFFLQGDGLAGTGGGDAAGITAQTAQELKAPALLSSLGAAYREDFQTPVNQGYPILTWQRVLGQSVRFTLAPAAALLVLRDAQGAVMAQNAQNSYLLMDGVYSYQVSLPGYFAQSGTVTVAGQAQAPQVTLLQDGAPNPPASADTLQTTLTDGQTQRGSHRTFDVIARDKNGAKLPAVCTLNGVSVPIQWDDTVKTSFTLTFTAPGANRVSVRAGNAQADYTIFYQKANPGEVIGQVTLAMEAFSIGGGYVVEPCTMDLLEGENAAQLLDRLLTRNGLSYTKTGSLQSGFYLSSVTGAALTALPTDAAKVPPVLLSAVGNSFGSPASWQRSDPRSLGEMDFTRGSGWMYCVNSSFPNVGFADYYLNDGDVARIQYTLAYGADVGGGFSAGSSTSAYYPIADKDALTALLAEKGVCNAPDSVLNTMMKLNASQDEVAAAFAALAKGEPIPPKPVLKPFDDVAQNAWFFDAVSFVREQKLFQGTSEFLFSPEEAMSRAMLCTVLHRGAGSPRPKGPAPFSDVNPDAWYSEAVAWAAEQGIAAGAGEGLFLPDQAVSRQELAAFLLRYAKHMGLALSRYDLELLSFADAAQIADWAKEAACFTQLCGLITGKEGNHFAPNDSATRAEVAVLFLRFSKNVLQPQSN